jgi:hypothetical protein
MKRTMITLGTLMAWTTTAIAATGQEPTGISLMTILFVGFGALIVVGQLVPALVIFCGMIKGLFGVGATEAKPVAGHK